MTTDVVVVNVVDVAPFVTSAVITRAVVTGSTDTDSSVVVVSMVTRG